MRLNPNAGGRHLALATEQRAPVIGIAEAVALAAARGPEALPPGFADAVLRLAFGRSGLPAAQGGPRLVQTPRPLLRREARKPKHGVGSQGADTERGSARCLTLIPRRD